MEFQPVARDEDLLEGQKRSFAVGTEEIAVFRVQGQLYALDNHCPHRGGPLAEGSLQGPFAVCPLHAWRFDVRTGICQETPMARVRTFPVEVRAGEICVGTLGTLPPP